MTLSQLKEYLRASDDDRRSYWLAKVMRQAKPDDAIVIAGVDEMRRLWPRTEKSLGRARLLGVVSRLDSRCPLAD